MDMNLIMAKMSEIDAGATTVDARAGERRDLADENLTTLSSLHANGHGDVVGDAMIADAMHGYQRQVADADLNQETAHTMRQGSENYRAMQQRCLAQYGNA